MPLFTEEKIRVCARDSLLSKKQVREISGLLSPFYPDLRFSEDYIKTTGDKDRKTSLKTLGKTNFFTKEIDEKLLLNEADIGIHSAKDLPDPYECNIEIIAITEGLTPADALVFREGYSLSSLPFGAKIAASSDRREKAIRELRNDFVFTDIRGTIEERLEILFSGQADGIVIAEAALIRLQLTHLSRLILPGKTVEGQGKLAVTAKFGNIRMKQIFSSIDSRIPVAP